MVFEIHKLGYEKLRVIPALSPSGMSWRCIFTDSTNKYNFIASNWLSKIETENPNLIHLKKTEELALDFIEENLSLMEKCHGKYETYTKWYEKMLKQLEDDELPYGYADYEVPKGFWRTTKGKLIETLPDEYKYVY
jgi:hypothetical protein